MFRYRKHRLLIECITNRQKERSFCTGKAALIVYVLFGCCHTPVGLAIKRREKTVCFMSKVIHSEKHYLSGNDEYHVTQSFQLDGAFRKIAGHFFISIPKPKHLYTMFSGIEPVLGKPV